jgi:hypothetical protein
LKQENLLDLTAGTYIMENGIKKLTLGKAMVNGTIQMVSTLKVLLLTTREMDMEDL